MPTSPLTSLLSELRESKPISPKRLAYYRRRFQNMFHRVILRVFREQQRETGLSQKELADRIGHRPEQINRWLGVPGNLTLNTISDLLLGMLVDLDEPSFTSLQQLAHEAEEQRTHPTGTAAKMSGDIEVATATGLSAVPASANSLGWQPGYKDPFECLADEARYSQAWQQ
jgi:hypothetical protein